MVGKAGLIAVIGFSVILGYMSLNLTRLAKKSTGIMASYADATLSHNLALTGANVGLSRFYADTTWFGDTTQTLSGPHLYGKFRINVVDLGSGNVRLRSVSTYTSAVLPFSETLHDTVEVFFNKNRQQTFSIFAWMTNNENGVNWTTQDTVWGRVHSNSKLTVNGKPVFWEKVTTTKGFNATPGKSPNNAIFKKGYETGVASVDLPDDLSAIDAAAVAGGRKFTTPKWLELAPGSSANDNGMVFVRNAPPPLAPIVDTIFLNNPAFNGAIVSTDSIHVKGTLDGRLSIASLKSNVYIDDDIKYEKNPMVTSSDDLLGIIADKNVIVTDNLANNTNCEINGCIFSRAGSFTAQGYNRGPLFGELRVLGSIVQETRGAVGTISGSTLATGYSKRYRYDDRLADPNYRPPFFPGYFMKTYAIANWWESFRVPSIDL
jgi:hypothetical protein